MTIPPAFDEISRVVTEHEDELIDFRRDLHRHPELGRAEVRTTRLVAERLESAGIAVRQLHGTGLLADVGHDGAHAIGDLVHLGVPLGHQAGRAAGVDRRHATMRRECDGIASDAAAQIIHFAAESLRLVPRNDLRRCLFKTDSVEPHAVGASEFGLRPPAEFVRLLTEAGVRTVADVRLRPDRSSMGSYRYTGRPATGIEKLLADAGVGYTSLPELGNLFLGFDDSLARYAEFFERSADLLVGRLLGLPGPVCLLCAEKRVDECHRKAIADYLAAQGHEVQHLGVSG